MDGSIFFPENDEYSLAKRICESCPVREPCLWADLRAVGDSPWFYGMFGGFTPGERRVLFDRLLKHGG